MFLKGLRDETHLDILEDFSLHHDSKQDLCPPKPATEVILLCFKHANRSIELKFLHPLNYNLDFCHFSSFRTVKWSIVFL